jgi:hypothetical protein
MATLATQDINIFPGLVPSYAAASGGGDNFTPDGDTYLHVKNASGGSITVTVDTPGTILGGTVQIGNPANTVAAGAEKFMGPYPANVFADYTNSGLAAVTYSGVTSLTIGAFRVRPTG